MSDAQSTRGATVLIGEAEQLDLPRFAHACGTTIAYVEEMILEGLVVPGGQRPGVVFGAEEITRVRRALRLQRAFDASLPSVAVMLDLLDEIERLRSQLLRAGVPPG